MHKDNSKITSVLTKIIVVRTFVKTGILQNRSEKQILSKQKIIYFSQYSLSKRIDHRPEQ